MAENKEIIEKEKMEMVYKVGAEEIKLNPTIVKRFLTKGSTDANLTDQEVFMFMSLCKFQGLNPFLNEAYLIKFKGYDAQIITAREALIKRAEDAEQFQGMESGIIISDKEGNVQELEGGFLPPNRTLLGAWCKVYRSDRKIPITIKVNLSEYDKKKSTWESFKCTMIVKVAEAQALKKAFPKNLTGMVLEEELKINEAEKVKAEIKTTEKTVINIQAEEVIESPVKDEKLGEGGEIIVEEPEWMKNGN